MKLTIRTITRSERLLYISFSIFLTFSFLMSSFYYRYFASIYKYIIATCVVLLIIQEVTYKRLSNKAFYGAILLYLLALFIMLRGTGNMQISFACIFIFAFAARNLNINKFFAYTALLTLALLLFVVVSSYLGIIPNYIRMTADRTRQYLGFLYALNAPAFFLNAELLYLYARKNKITIFEIISIFIFALFLFQTTQSRLSFWLSTFSLCIALVNRSKKGLLARLKVLPKLSIPVFAMMSILSITLSVLYNPGVTWMKNLNDFLSGRLVMGKTSILRYGISLFGNPDIEWIGNGLNMYGEQSTKAYLYVDNVYVQLLQRYGIVFFCAFIILTTLLMYKCVKKKDNYLVVILAIVAFHGLIESGVLYIQFNTFWILFGPALFGKNWDRPFQSEKTNPRMIMHVRKTENAL